MTAEFLNRNFIPLFLIVGFSMKLWRQRGSADKSLRYHWMTVVSTFVLIIADSLEIWASMDPALRFWRILFSVTGYIMRPTAALSILLIVYPKLRRPFWLWIPNIVNALVYGTAFFSGIAFGFHEDSYSFFRGPLGYTVFAVSFLYIAAAVVLTWISFRDKDHARERIILYISAAACVCAALIDMETEGAHLNAAILISSVFLYMFLRSIDMNRDPLTKLLNRISFYDDCGRLGASISAVASLDMNGLKYMNDSMGHEAGDEALKTIGMNLQEIRNNRILPYRIGGDEFAILFIRQDEEIVKNVLGDLKQRIQAKGYNLAVGYTMRGLSSASVQDLVRWADEKMYAEKAKFYSENKHDRRRSGR
ncbi:MAG: GGDEF domain-containing protein [Clostridia bacterium]|nr:GGDEF domain-containing protein [Clostridia bacterium]